ncbi:MAG: coenzyme F420-0:L-glutamate ligase [Firmicutes bacterium]|nr:coenzyme F420-0:L-glutamate ligase [Bacillota bacterium]
MSKIGTVAMGIRAPIIREGDDLVKIVTNSVLEAVKENKLTLNDKDVVSVTEAVLARAQGNYATVEQIAKDVHEKFGNETVGLVFPILSRNRFFLPLKGIAKGVKKLIVQLSYPADEVGNQIVGLDVLDELGINPATISFKEEDFRMLCPETKHKLTGVDYIQYYKNAGLNIEIVLSNDPAYILQFTKFVISADIHSRERTRKLLKRAGAYKVVTLCEILSKSVDGSGFHPKYGLLGSNLATANSVKLFPRDSAQFTADLQKSLYEATGKILECMVYGDGAFKDPVEGIWELADPVVSPGYTKGLLGSPNELKLKYIADNNLKGLSEAVAQEELKKIIASKKQNSDTSFASQGTTPRRIVDLLGSLSDLTSGSGDKGTPIVLIQNYFKNYAE